LVAIAHRAGHLRAQGSTGDRQPTLNRGADKRGRAAPD
jgi:hypothetical protein